jgi:L-aminopeptidase/D-esterase-like protein
VRPAANNLVTDVTGVKVGHATDEHTQSGVTVLTCGGEWVAACDIRGGGPGGRESDALAPENLVGRAHAIVLAGGSVFGLSAADGVTAALAQRGIGLQLRAGTLPIPIVPSAVLHDLANGGDKNWGMHPPYRELGIRALDAAAGAFAMGSVGAGRGAMAGLVKGGIGSTSLDLGNGLVVGALVALNSVGSVHMPDSDSFWAWPFEMDAEFGGRGPPRASTRAHDPVPHGSRLAEIGRLTPGVNTTLAIIACNADLSGVECKRVAMMAQDGIARAIRPAHTLFDGDTVYVVASGAIAFTPGALRAAEVSRLGAAAADCLARACARAAYFAADPSLR